MQLLIEKLGITGG